MSYPTDRVLLFDRSMQPIGELAPDEVFSRVRSEEINGEHSLVIVTTRRMQEGWRALTVDGTGRWREWVVTEIDEEHESGNNALGTYHLVWSLQYDLTKSYYHDTGDAVSIGIGTTATSTYAATQVLTGVPNWTVGDCDAPDIEAGTGCVFIRESAWSKLSKLVEATSCEVDSVIEVSSIFGVTARKLCLLGHVGSEEALRRFDWGHDLTSIKRTPDPGPYYCRVVPLGKSKQQEYADDDETQFDYPIDITEETGTEGNPGPYWIQDDEAAEVFKILLPNGTYQYPTIAVNYSEEDPELLLNEALKELHDYTRPGVTYEANVVQLAQAGMNVQGVALGDEVQVVDYGFNPDAALRIQGRIIKIELDELAPEATTELTIGQLRDGITDTINYALTTLNTEVSGVSNAVAGLSTAAYIKSLISRLNAEINATGGYSYIVPGEGIITFDEEVVDPLTGIKSDGTYAGQATQIKGGSIRIANTHRPTVASIDDWDWKTVFTSGVIATGLVTASNIVSGIIEDGAHKLDSTTGNYWNLETGELRMSAASANVGSTTLANYISQATSDATNALDQLEILSRLTGGHVNEGLYINNGHLYMNASYILSGFLGNANGNYWDLQNGGMRFTGELAIRKASTGSDYLNADIGEFTVTDIRGGVNGTTTQQTFYGFRLFEGTGTTPGVTGKEVYIVPNTKVGSTAGIFSTRAMKLVACVNDDANTYNKSAYIALNTNGVDVGNKTTSTDNSYFRVSSNQLTFTGYRNSSTTTIMRLSVGTTQSTTEMRIYGNIQCDTISANNIKSRLVSTDDYGKRMLFCYETSTPMFGDVGSGTTDDSGVCYVSIDDIFSETARTDLSYQVFLQKCGSGDIWVDEKTPTYFVVRGTPNLAFDWEVKARQFDQANTRLEDNGLKVVEEDVDFASKTVASYSEENDYLTEIERLYEGDLYETA